MTEDLWQGRTAYITSFWGWSPQSWGSVGYTFPRRRDSIIQEATDPFIAVVYVTKSSHEAPTEMLGKVVGFYLVSHETGHRDEHTHPDHHGREPDKWVHSLKAVRAFSFVPEYRPDIEDIDRSFLKSGMPIAAHGKKLTVRHIRRLRRYPYVEVEVYGGANASVGTIEVPQEGLGLVRAGPPNRSGYSVPGEPRDTEKELYVLRLEGDPTAFLGEPAGEREIFKVGMSLSPTARLWMFQKSLPRGSFSWELDRSTRSENDEPYDSFERAEAGERAMKIYLSRDAKHLGGEFYAATKNHLNEAWRIGREAARAYEPPQAP